MKVQEGTRIRIKRRRSNPILFWILFAQSFVVMRTTLETLSVFQIKQRTAQSSNFVNIYFSAPFVFLCDNIS